MNIEQERQDFEAWYRRQYIDSTPLIWAENVQAYRDFDHNQLFGAYQAGRAALQSQDREDAQEWLKQHETLMHRVSKAAIAVGYSNKGEAKLMQAEKALIDHARRIEENK